MSLVDTVMTCITDPYGTMEHLLHEREVPPYIVSSFIALITVFVAPTIWYQYQYNIRPVAVSDTYALCLILSITFVFFVLFTILLLRLLGVTAPAIKVLAASVYSLTPFVPLMVGYYIANYLAIGNLSVTSYFVTGKRAHGDWFVSFFPVFIKFGIFFSFMVFSSAMRIIGRMGLPTGLIVGTLAIPILLGSYFIGATCSEAIFTGSARTTTKWLTSYLEEPQ